MGELVVIFVLMSVALLSVHLAQICQIRQHLGYEKVLFPRSLGVLALFVFTFLISNSWNNLILIPLTVLTYPIALIDWNSYRVPNTLSGFLALTQIASILASSLVMRNPRLILSIFYGLLSFLVLLALHIVKKDQLGLGDVKLTFSLGTIISLYQTHLIIVAFLVAFLTSSVYILIMLVLGRLNFQDKIPFAPFMLAGTWITLGLM